MNHSEAGKNFQDLDTAHLQKSFGLLRSILRTIQSGLGVDLNADRKIIKRAIVSI